jgi:hypothetical protein
MAPPNSIAPRKGDEICGSPTPSTASVASVVSIDSLFSDPDMISPTALETPVPHQPVISCGGKMQAGIQLTIDESFLRHDKYLFKDGNITFLVRHGAPVLVCIRAHQQLFRSKAPPFASTDTFSLVILPISPPDSPSLLSVITKLCLRSCQWAM